MKKKIIPLVMIVVVLIVMVATPTAALEVHQDKFYTGMEVLAVTEAKRMEPKIKQYLQNNGVSLQDNETISLVKLSDGTEALNVVKQDDEDGVESYLIYGLDKDGSIVDVPVTITTATRGNEIQDFSWVPNRFNQAAITITIMAKYDTVMDVSNYPVTNIFYKPAGFNFSYKYNNGAVDVENIRMQLQCEGVEYNGNYEYVSDWRILKICERNVNDPIAGQIYQATGQLPPDTNIGQGWHLGSNSGIFVVMEATIDDNYDSSSWQVVS